MKTDRFTALRYRIDTASAGLRDDIKSGKIPGYACAMSPVSTLVHEIWMIAEDIAKEFEHLDIPDQSVIISNPALAALKPPPPVLSGHFDYIHYALEIAVLGKQS
jgi:hypothetical protein